MSGCLDCSACLEIDGVYYSYQSDGDTDVLYISGGARVTDGALLKAARQKVDDKDTLDPAVCQSGGSSAAMDELKTAIQALDDRQIEFDSLPLGCTKDAAGEVSGKVIQRTTISEADSSETQALYWIGISATAVQTYDPAVHGAWALCDAPVSTLHTEFSCCEKIDDVNGDQTELVAFVQRVRVDIDLVSNAITRTVIGTYEDACMQTPYTVLGTVVDPDSAGTELVGIKWMATTVTGPATWSESALLSVTFTGISGVDSVITTGAGSATLAASQTRGWSTQDLVPVGPLPSLSVPLGAVVAVDYAIPVYDI